MNRKEFILGLSSLLATPKLKGEWDKSDFDYERYHDLINSTKNQSGVGDQSKVVDMLKTELKGSFILSPHINVKMLNYHIHYDNEINKDVELGYQVLSRGYNLKESLDVLEREIQMAIIKKLLNKKSYKVVSKLPYSDFTIKYSTSIPSINNAGVVLRGVCMNLYIRRFIYSVNNIEPKVMICYGIVTNDDIDGMIYISKSGN